MKISRRFRDIFGRDFFHTFTKWSAITARAAPSSSFSLVASRHSACAPAMADATSRMVFAGHQNLYVGRLPEGMEAPATFDTVSRQIRASTGCMVIGIRDPDNGTEQVNPDGDQLVMPDAEILYLSSEPRLESA